MDKVRIRDLAKDLGMETSREILAFLEKIGAKGKSASSNLEGDLIERVKGHFKKPAQPPPPPQTTVLTRSDGVIERRSQKVILRRGSRSAHAPEKARGAAVAGTPAEPSGPPSVEEAAAPSAAGEPVPRWSAEAPPERRCRSPRGGPVPRGRGGRRLCGSSRSP
jgi:hypothetical protein